MFIIDRSKKAVTKLQFTKAAGTLFGPLVDEGVIETRHLRGAPDARLFELHDYSIRYTNEKPLVTANANDDVVFGIQMYNPQLPSSPQCPVAGVFLKTKSWPEWCAFRRSIPHNVTFHLLTQHSLDNSKINLSWEKKDFYDRVRSHAWFACVPISRYELPRAPAVDVPWSFEKHVQYSQDLLAWYKIIDDVIDVLHAKKCTRKRTKFAPNDSEVARTIKNKLFYGATGRCSFNTFPSTYQSALNVNVSHRFRETNDCSLATYYSNGEHPKRSRRPSQFQELPVIDDCTHMTKKDHVELRRFNEAFAVFLDECCEEVKRGERIGHFCRGAVKEMQQHVRKVIKYALE